MNAYMCMHVYERECGCECVLVFVCVFIRFPPLRNIRTNKIRSAGEILLVTSISIVSYEHSFTSFGCLINWMTASMTEDR